MLRRKKECRVNHVYNDMNKKDLGMRSMNKNLNICLNKLSV